MPQPVVQQTRRRERVRIGDLSIDPVTLTEAAQVCDRAVTTRKPLQVATVNLRFLTQAGVDQAFRDTVNDAGLVVADGKPVLWLARLSGSRLPERVTGHDLVHTMAGLSAQKGYSIFFLGGTSELVKRARSYLEARYPGLKFAGAYSGRFGNDGFGLTPAEEADSLEAIRAAMPDLLFVALGCPKQEFWIRNHQSMLGVPVAIGVGSVLDVLGGKVKRAPEWAQRSGLEWIFRLAQEPRRMWRRYLVEDLPTAVRISLSAVWDRGSSSPANN